MEFIDFCRVLGLVVDHVEFGRWVHVPTTDKPRSKNGAYKFMGHVGYAQNHRLQSEVSEWKSEREYTVAETQAIANQAAEFDAKMRSGWAKAAARSEALVGVCEPTEHDYLALKGFPEERGLVAKAFTRPKRVDGGFVQRTDTNVLVVPMRDLADNALRGCQLVFWDAAERRWEKEMISGMRARGAVFRLGSRRAARTWLVEGYATGLSVLAALRLRRLPDSVLVCFSAGNLVQVAKQLQGEVAVFADNDVSGAGERAAVAAGRPWVMSPTAGCDANDMHLKAGLFRVAALMSSVPRRMVDTVP